MCIYFKRKVFIDCFMLFYTRWVCNCAIGWCVHSRSWSPASLPSSGHYVNKPSVKKIVYCTLHGNLIENMEIKIRTRSDLLYVYHNCLVFLQATIMFHIIAHWTGCAGTTMLFAHCWRSFTKAMLLNRFTSVIADFNFNFNFNYNFVLGI